MVLSSQNFVNQLYNLFALYLKLQDNQNIVTYNIYYLLLSAINTNNALKILKNVFKGSNLEKFNLG